MLKADRLTALVVDDNAYARAAAAASLRQLGATHIIEAAGGSAAVGQLLAARFDVMLMDWYMPEMSGAALIEVLRDARFGANVALPVILMTAYPSRDIVARARSLGVNEVLVKPLTADALAVALERVLPERVQPGGGRQGSESKVFL